MHITNFHRVPQAYRHSAFIIHCRVGGRDKEYLDNLFNEWQSGGARSEGTKFSLTHDILCRATTRQLQQELERRTRLRLAGKTTGTK